MKVIRSKKDLGIKFSELKAGDTFIDPSSENTCGPEMKIEYADIDYNFSTTGESEDGFASVELETGNVFFYTEDFYVIPIKLKAVEE